MVSLLDDLEERGYLVRQRHPRDRRAFLLWPTEAGRDLEIAAVRSLDEQQRRSLSPLSRDERRTLGALLKRLNHGRPD